MKIKQVEELVGITSKNIRFYEEQGLLQPRRTENGYRDYQTEDVELLKKIKLFRKLGVPVEQIHRLFQGQISVDECLENQKAVLQKEQDNIDLYCGAGTIGLTMADKCKRLIGIEIVRQAVENAKENAKINSVENAEFICEIGRASCRERV